MNPKISPKVKNIINASIVAIILIFLVFNFFLVVIDAGKVGVVTTFGQVSDNPLDSGIHLKNPFSNVIVLSTRTEDYTMSRSVGEGQRYGDDSIEILSSDGLTISLDVTVLYRVEKQSAPKLYKELGLDFQEKVIRPEIRSKIRGVTSQFTVTDIYSAKRAEVNEQIITTLTESLQKRGIILEEVLLRDVVLPDSLKTSIAQKLSAQQEAEKLTFEIEKTKKEAERKVIEAQGQRDAQRIVSESLTPTYLQYLYILGLKENKGTIYVPTDPNNGLPLFRGL